MSSGVTVVIPCKNMGDVANRAIDSAFAAGADSVIFVDDGSGDSSYFAVYERDRLIKKHVSCASVGVCGARNLAINSAGHRLIIPLDADDELLPDGIGLLKNEWSSSTLVYGGWYEGNTYFSPPPAEMLIRKNVAHATWLFDQMDWFMVGGYDPDFNIGGEDYAFMVALVNAGVKPIRVDVPIYRKHMREGSRTDAARSRYPFIQQLLREKYPTFFSS